MPENGVLSTDAPLGTRRLGVAERRRLQRDLAGMAEGTGLGLRYHPRHDLAQGEPVGAEAVICWPRHRMMALPRDLTPPERGALEIGVGGWALRGACASAAAWADGVVSVGVAGSQLRDHALIAQVADALDRSGLAPERLELSLGEAVAAEIGLDALLMLSALRDLGIGLALDDFGADAASLSLLKRLPLTGLKLSRMLLRDVPADPADSAIAGAVMEAAHALGLHVVADGVDCESQLAFLACCRCDAGQGALFTAPCR